MKDQPNKKKGNDAKLKLEEFGRNIVKDIESKKNPKFVTGARTRSNITFNEKKGYLSLGPAQEERNFLNVAQSKRFMQTVAIA